MALFHLRVFGQVLLSLRAVGADLRSRAPISGGSAGPAYEVVLPDGETWDLWFEAAGAWGYHARKSPYAEAASWAPGSTRPVPSTPLWPRTNVEWRKKKIGSMKRRDRDTDRRLAAAGWHVVRIWEHEDPVQAADAIQADVRRPMRSKT